MALKRSVGIGAVTLCVALTACKDDTCNGQDRDTAGCRSSGHGGGGTFAGSARSGSSDGTSTTHGGFGSAGHASGGSGGE